MKKIVLIGMPSSGKSTVGAQLAEALHLPFIDIDATIVSRINMSIPDYFARHGEEAFRQIEREVIALLAPLGDCVIATGGGAILAKENVTALKKNGILVFLDRPLDLLLCTSDRPLSSSRAAVAALYKIRYPLYCAAADIRVDASGDVQTVVNTIRKELGL